MARSVLFVFTHMSSSIDMFYTFVQQCTSLAVFTSPFFLRVELYSSSSSSIRGSAACAAAYLCTTVLYYCIHQQTCRYLVEGMLCYTARAHEVIAA